LPLADLSTLDIVWIALSVFLVVVGLGLGLVLFNLSGTVRRLTSFIQGLEKEVLPVINKAGAEAFGPLRGRRPRRRRLPGLA
jgi:hypothetical protein